MKKSSKQAQKPAQRMFSNAAPVLHNSPAKLAVDGTKKYRPARIPSSSHPSPTNTGQFNLDVNLPIIV